MFWTRSEMSVHIWNEITCANQHGKDDILQEDEEENARS